MVRESLDEVRVTADRVRRFSDAVEETPSEPHRRLWRAALDDLRAAIRHARAEGCETKDIQDATGVTDHGRFTREPDVAADATSALP
jgi:hypothetical protein